MSLDLERLLQSAGTNARLVKYETEEAFIEKAKRIANIRPGDIFYSHDEDGSCRKCVFVNWDDVRMNAFYLEDGRIKAGAMTPSSVTFEHEYAEFKD